MSIELTPVLDKLEVKPIELVSLIGQINLIDAYVLML